MPRIPGSPHVRDATAADMGDVQRIYAFHVQHGLASFEESPPDRKEIARRFTAVRGGGFPYLVATLDGRVVGYAYAAHYRPRPAYRHTLENSIYIDEDVRGRGVGRALLATLIERCEALGYRQMLAVIGDSANHASIGLHAALGFRRAALLTSVGYKSGRWVDSVIMQRSLGRGDSTLPE